MFGKDLGTFVHNNIIIATLINDVSANYTVLSRKRAHGRCTLQSSGPTLVTSILQLYAKVRTGLHTL